MLTSALFQSLFDLEIAIEIRQVLDKKKISIQTLLTLRNEINNYSDFLFIEHHCFSMKNEFWSSLR